MKKIVALLLCGMLAAAMFTGCGSDSSVKPGTDDVKESENSEKTDSKEEESAPAEESAEDVAVEKTYDEKISFSITNYYSMYKAAAGFDLEADPYIQWMLDKFNVEIDAWVISAQEAEDQARLWVNGGTMPDAMAWPSITVAELTEYADQELLQPLPEDWETTWPNLAKMVKKSGYAEMVKVDGLTYGIPHTSYGNFADIGKPVVHNSVYFRKDWAAQVGMPDLGKDSTIKLSELKEYLEKVKEAGLCDNPTLSATTSNLRLMFQLACGINPKEFVKTDSGYVWMPAEEGYTEYLKLLKEWYDAGLIDPDFYNKEGKTAYSEFQEGIIAAMYYDGGIGNYGDMIGNYLEGHGLDKTDDVERQKVRDMFGIVSVQAEDGTVYGNGSYAYWMVHSFSPECSPEKMERILDMMDYFSTKEGQISERLAIPEEDWTMDADGKINILNEDIISGAYEVSPSRFFNVWGYAGDDLAYAPGIPGRYEAEQKLILKNFEVKNAGVVFDTDDKVEALSTPAKKQYSVDLKAKIGEIITGSEDVDTAWAQFVEENRPMWEPVVDDLNQ